MKRLHSIIGIWLLLLFLVLPMDYRLLPDVGNYLSRFLLPINEWISTNFFATSVSATYDKSDSLAFFTGAFFLGIIAILMSYATSKYTPHTKKYIPIFLIGFTSYYLIRYGCDKIIGVQFYQASPNTLHTKLGMISKDLLFWNTMGSSSFYNWFMAMGEIVTGILLLINRTRFLGLLLSIGIFSNILAINIGFDITVKYLATLLLYTSVYLISNYKNRLLGLIGSKVKTIDVGIHFNLQSLSSKLIFSATIVVFFIEVSIPLFNHSMQHPLFSSSFKLINHAEFEMIHFHKDGYLIFQNGSHFKSQRMTFTPNQLYSRAESYQFELFGDSIELIDNNGVKIKGVKFNNSSLPLLQDDTHLYLEQMLP